MNTITITTRTHGDVYHARGGGHSASCTSDERTAVRRVAVKLGHPKGRLRCERACLLDDTGWRPGLWTLEPETP